MYEYGGYTTARWPLELELKVIGGRTPVSRMQLTARRAHGGHRHPRNTSNTCKHTYLLSLARDLTCTSDL